MIRAIITRGQSLDALLLAVPRHLQYLAIVFTIARMVLVSVPNVPRSYLDYSRIPLLEDVRQYETHGTDTIGSEYVAKVTLNDVADMYTREALEQTPLERAAWTKEESAPYPPAALLVAAGLYALGAWTGVQYYGMILILAAVFVALSLWYFLNTRWYLFPILYLNFAYFGYRFVYVQDGTYLAMLVVVMIALLLARYRHQASHAFMALAIVMKVSPIGYATNIFAMKRPMAGLFVAILFVGLVLPATLWNQYLDIYGFHLQIKGNVYDAVAAVVLVVPFTLLLWYVETRLKFDDQDRIGWGLVPFAMFLGLKMRVARHLLIVLLVPDKRGPRNIAAAIGLMLFALLPEVFRLGSVLYITTVLLFATLVYYLDAIGWDTVLDDVRHPARTTRMMLAA